MDTYYTIEEKYLKAVDKRNYGYTRKSLRLLNDIIETEPLYARAHYQLGLIHFYDIQDYQTAGYHLKLCAELEPSFPDVYIPYLELLVFLNMEKNVASVSKKALQVPGVDHSEVYKQSGLIAEKGGNWPAATECFRKALLSASNKGQVSAMQQCLERIELKVRSTKTFAYSLIE